MLTRKEMGLLAGWFWWGGWEAITAWETITMIFNVAGNLYGYSSSALLQPMHKFVPGTIFNRSAGILSPHLIHRPGPLGLFFFLGTRLRVIVFLILFDLTLISAFFWPHLEHRKKVANCSKLKLSISVTLIGTMTDIFSKCREVKLISLPHVLHLIAHLGNKLIGFFWCFGCTQISPQLYKFNICSSTLIVIVIRLNNPHLVVGYK